jgi:hypothetical protein
MKVANLDDQRVKMMKNFIKLYKDKAKLNACALKIQK